MTAPRPLPELLLTEVETARVLKCSKTTVVKYIADGTIPSIKIGGLRRIRWSDLIECIGSIEPTLPGDDARSAA